MKKPNVNEFSDLKAPKFKPTIWFKLFPSPFTVSIPKKFMKQCIKELNRLSGGDYLGEELYAFAYEKYTGRDIMDFPFINTTIVALVFAFITAYLTSLICG